MVKMMRDADRKHPGGHIRKAGFRHIQTSFKLQKLSAVHARGLNKTGEHTSMKKEEVGGTVCMCLSVVCVCVCVCVRSTRPGDSQAYNYTLVGVKLITEA